MQVSFVAHDRAHAWLNREVVILVFGQGARLHFRDLRSKIYQLRTFSQSCFCFTLAEGKKFPHA